MSHQLQLMIKKGNFKIYVRKIKSIRKQRFLQDFMANKLVFLKTN